MSMKVHLLLQMELELFQLEEVKQAERLAQQSNFNIYSWKTSDNENWLERGLSITDVLGIVLLPQDLPAVIDLPNDEEGEN